MGWGAAALGLGWGRYGSGGPSAGECRVELSQ
jgi:hypothetical protein